MSTLFETQRNIEAHQKYATATSSAGGAAVITLSGVTDVVHILNHLWLSYSDTPTGGGITITIGGATFLDHDITASGPESLPLHRMNDDTTGSEVVITLKAGGGSVVSKLTVQYF